jgi:hypothetical protein
VVRNVYGFHPVCPVETAILCRIPVLEYNPEQFPGSSETSLIWEAIMDITSLIAQIIGGIVGGTASGKVIKDSDLGGIGNLITGAIGGIGGGTILSTMLGQAAAVAPAGGSMDIGHIIGQLVGGGVGGVILQIIVGLIKNKMMAR